MRLTALVPLVAAAAFTLSAPASAVTVVVDAGNLEDFSYTVSNGTRTITLFETWGPNTLRNVDIKFTGFQVTRRSWTIIKYVTNNTDYDFNVFQHELLNTDKSQSDNEDGLSFAQNGIPPIERVSDSFADVFVDELDFRDYLRFSNGVIKQGDTGMFKYGITVTTATENDPFFLRQTAIVPEPATWAMLITGFGLVGFALRRRKASIASVAS